MKETNDGRAHVRLTHLISRPHEEPRALLIVQLLQHRQERVHLAQVHGDCPPCANRAGISRASPAARVAAATANARTAAGRGRTTALARLKGGRHGAVISRPGLRRQTVSAGEEAEAEAEGLREAGQRSESLRAEAACHRWDSPFSRNREMLSSGHMSGVSGKA